MGHDCGEAVKRRDRDGYLYLLVNRAKPGSEKSSARRWSEVRMFSAGWWGVLQLCGWVEWTGGAMSRHRWARRLVKAGLRREGRWMREGFSAAAGKIPFTLFLMRARQSQTLGQAQRLARFFRHAGIRILTVTASSSSLAYRMGAFGCCSPRQARLLFVYHLSAPAGEKAIMLLLRLRPTSMARRFLRGILNARQGMPSVLW